MKRVLILSILLLLSSCSKEGGKFVVEVTQVPLSGGSVGLIVSWDIPTEYDDGTPLPMNEIFGYKVYYGLTSKEYTVEIDAPDVYVNTLIIPNLPPNTYYIAVSTYYSDYSDEVKFILE